MKGEKWFSCLIGSIIAFGLSLSVAGCLVTGFWLTDDVSMAEVARSLAMVSAISALWFGLVKRGWIPALGISAVLFILLKETDVLLSLEALVYEISDVYNSGYGWGVIRWSDVSLNRVDITDGVVLVGSIVALAATWTVCRPKWSGFALIPAMLLLMVCCVLTDTVPATGWLFLLLTTAALLILTQSVRRRNQVAGIRLTALMLVPVLIASTVLFWTVPEDGYGERLGDALQQVMAFVNSSDLLKSDDFDDLSGSFGVLSENEVDLSKLGPEDSENRPVMDVVADKGGLMYLRGQSYEIYDGESWLISEEEEDWSLWPSEGLWYFSSVKISTNAVHSMLYTPYYTLDNVQKDQQKSGMVYNQKLERHYTIKRMVYGDIQPGAFANISDQTRARFTNLPESTLTAARAILAEQGISADTMTTQEIVASIEAYVENSATYSLDTGKMPSGADDFAIWFLTQSDTGYCVHFATAATVLLRAAGVPARYVTGYMFRAIGGSHVTVTSDRAHAWVEYLDPDAGWSVLDATPGLAENLMSGTSNSTTPSQSTTEPSGSTEPSTEPTQPSHTAAETNPSKTETTPSESGTNSTEGTTSAEPVNTSEAFDWSRITKWLWIPGICLAIWLQYVLRCRIRRKRWQTGPANRRGLRRWRCVLLWCKLMRLQPPDRLRDLAEKAVFSQHSLNEEELAEFDTWMEEVQVILKKELGIFRWVIKLIFAI